MTKIKTIKNEYTITVETPNGSGYTLPIEVVKGMRDGEIENKYMSACEFLNSEDKSINITQAGIKHLFESSL